MLTLSVPRETTLKHDIVNSLEPQIHDFKVACVKYKMFSSPNSTKDESLLTSENPRRLSHYDTSAHLLHVSKHAHLVLSVRDQNSADDLL